MKSSGGVEFVFYSPRRGGVVLHTALAILFTLAALYSFDQLGRTGFGQRYAVFLALFIVMVVSIPVMLYRLYGLLRSQYRLDPNGITLRWGMRVEQIPIGEVRSVILAADLSEPLPLPLFGMPGAVLGLRSHKRFRYIEYLAGTPRGLVLIETRKQAFAISPTDPQGFISTFYRVNEFGSVEPVANQSVYPGMVLGAAWGILPARFLLLAGLGVSLMVLIWGAASVTAAPGLLVEIPGTAGAVRSVGAPQLVLLPVLNAFYYLLNASLALFFLRDERTHVLAYLLLLGSLLCSGLTTMTLLRALS